MCFFFFQAEDGIRDRSPSRGLGDVYKRQMYDRVLFVERSGELRMLARLSTEGAEPKGNHV